MINESISSLIQDSRGFLWIGTGQGLYRYDGYRFKLYNVGEDTINLITNSVASLYEDDQQRIWVGTGHGIFMLDPSTEKFKSFEALTKSAAISRPVKSICQDKRGDIWFTTETHQNGMGSLVFFDQVNNRFEKYDGNGLLHWPRTIVRDEYDNFWIAAGMGVVIFNPDTKQVIKHIPNIWDSTNPEGLRSDLSSVYFEQAGRIWATAYNGGISRIEYDSSYEYSFGVSFQKRNGLVDDCTMAMTKDRHGQYWVATLNGLSVIDLQHNTIRNFTASDTDPYSIRTPFCTRVLEDRSGNIWISHAGGGLSKLRPNKGFISLTANGQGTGMLAGGQVGSVYADPEDNLWIVIHGKGIQKFWFNNNFSRPPQSTFYPVMQSGIWEMEKTNKNSLLIGAISEGLFLLNDATGSVKRLSDSGASMVRMLPSGDVIYSVLTGRRLFKFNIGTNRRRELIPDSTTLQRPIWPEYSSFARETDRLFWLSTWQGDLYSYDSENDTFTKPVIKPYELLRISQLHIDKHGYLWITAFEGTFKFRIERTSKVPTLILEKKYTEKDGMKTKAGASNLFTAAMVEDHDGNLWLGQVGLTRLDPKTHQVKVYDEEDGMPGSTISQPMAARLSSGHLAFGTNRGAFLFHPDSLKDNQTMPPVVLTDFTLLNQTGMLPKSEYELSHHQNVMTFEFAALDFTAPETNQYAYQMVGFDQDWVYSENRRSATYTNLDPGTYTFRVKGSNNDGLWNENGTSIKIIILPPPWRTWWAYSLYGVIFLSMLWIARNEIIKRERLNNEFQLKKIEADKYHELDTMKSRFFANISHEFRTPLTLILGPIQKRLMLANSPEDKTELALIQRNAQRLLKLVNQLLDLSRLEAGTMSLKCSADDLVVFTRLIVQSFHSMAEAKGIKYTFESNVDRLEVFFDHEKLEKVIINLLSNAFKFTPAGGEITVIISSRTLKDGESKEGFAEILVCDSGIGIPAEHLEKIFDRFYQVDSSQTREYEGTGIGLALTKELVDLHHGTITVKCSTEQGTVFTVRLPLGTSHLQGSEIQEGTKRERSVEISLLSDQHDARLGDLLNGQTETVMIVEDNADLRYYLIENMRSQYKILEASDGEDGLTLAFEKVPDLIISDLMMPRMDGVQLSQRLKNDERTSHIPIVLLTAKADSETKIQGLELGADDYIPKPFDMKELLVRVRNLIEGRKKLREKYSSQLDLSAKKVELHVKKVKAFSVDERFLQKALDIVDKNIASSSFSVEVFAQEVGMSTAQLYRKLTALTGYSPNDFVRHFRLQRAADLLSQQAGNISEIAYDTGFNNLSYFSKCFKEKFGVTPSEYINK